MKTRINLLAIVALLLAAVAPALADVTPPKRDKRGSPASSEITVRMRIEPSLKASEARLEIPRSVFQQIKAELDGDDSPVVGATTHYFNLGSAQTVVAGVFLSLAFAFGGVWFARSRKLGSKPARAALGVVVVAICGTIASVAYANAGPPPVARSLTSRILIPEALPYGVYGEVKVSIVEDGNQITLVLPKGKEARK